MKNPAGSPKPRGVVGIRQLSLGASVVPTVKVYAHGVSMGQPGHNSQPPPRGIVKGWTQASIRRNRNFLYSVDVEALKALPGLGLTLTLRDCPPTAADWSRLRDVFLDSIRREGFVLVHWVTEWQRRRVPHLHLAIFLPAGTDSRAFALKAVTHWLRIAAAYRPRLQGQFWNPIFDALGWNQYLSKHAARGLRHYQRSASSLPEGWQGGSAGRMWGKLGDWPLAPVFSLSVSHQGFAMLRRFLRSWRVADARLAILKAKGPKERLGAVRRLRAARRMLLCPDPFLSKVRGCSEWFGQDLMLRCLDLLASSGCPIESI